MKSELLKEVWKIRFEKMNRLEDEAVQTYERILKDHEEILKKTGADLILNEIIKDEKKHFRLTEELKHLAAVIVISEYETGEAD